MSNKIKVDFKKCPYCGSEDLKPIYPHPAYNHVADEYRDLFDCGDCEAGWTTIYEPCRNESDPLALGEENVILNSRFKN